MSRCFPFPPPGYEKKIRIDEADPLIKEKYKEKKHKKDKDREKKEGKEKKSKDRSKDKQKEKKEKHKDRKDKEKSKPLEEKKAEVPKNSGHREKLVTSTVQNNSNGESKYVQELARRIRYEEEATRSQSAQKINDHNQRSLEIAFENSSFCPIQETNHSREDDDKRINSQKNFAAENAVARGSFGADRAEVMGKPMESPEKIHRTTKSDKLKDKEGVKKNEAKDKDRNKEKKEGKINETRLEKPKLIGGSKLEERGKDSLDKRNCKPRDLSRASVKNLIETNGLLYENGRTLVAQRTPPKPSNEVQGRMCKPESKEVKINGFVISGEKQEVCPPNKENGEASAKPPHPDLKYLNQILNLPKRNLLLEVSDDEEEWLFGQLGVKLKKARRDSPGSGESLQVWNQAFRIESADIAALPYVVPF